jgi:glycosyltransferase involved in cell wall biosynthesis
MKGLETLLEVFKIFKKNGDAFTAHVVGEGSLKKSLMAAATNIPEVTFTGFIPAPALYKEYAEAEIFCGLSRSEALGNVFLEAEAAGCAIVATRVGGIPEIVNDGETGMLVAPDDAASAAESIARLLNEAHLRKMYGDRAIAHAQEYDWDPIARQYAALY